MARPVIVASDSSAGGRLDSSPTLSYNHTSGDLLAIVAGTYIPTATALTAAWNGVAMTLLDSHSNASYAQRKVAVFRLTSAATGTFNLTIAGFTVGYEYGVISAHSVTGWAGTISSVLKSAAGVTRINTFGVTAGADDLALGVFCANRGGNGTGTFVAGSGCTELVNRGFGSGLTGGAAQIETKAATGTVTVDVTETGTWNSGDIGASMAFALNGSGGTFRRVYY